MDRIKDVAETVGVSVAVIASETWNKAKVLAEDLGHRTADLAEDLKDRVAGSTDGGDRAPDA